eukprot:scaffold74877_cov38-Cyclotella_meneghiniana.AAC.7
MDNEDVFPAFIGNYQAYVIERLNKFTVTPPFLPSICQSSISAVIDLLPRPTITNTVTFTFDSDVSDVGDAGQTGFDENMTNNEGRVASTNDKTDDLIIEEFINESAPVLTGLIVKVHHGMYVNNDDGRVGINKVIIEAVGTILVLLNNLTIAEEITNVLKLMKEESKSQIRNNWLPELCQVTSDVAYLLGGPHGYIFRLLFLVIQKHAIHIFEEDGGRIIRQGFVDIQRIMNVLRYLL